MKSSSGKYSDTKAIRVHRLRIAGLSWSKIHEQMGIAVSTACAWDKIVVEDPELLKKAEGSPFDTKEMRKKNGSKKIETAQQALDVVLKEENDFLKWWNQGERRGWVDRLLSEVQR